MNPEQESVIQQYKDKTKDDLIMEALLPFAKPVQKNQTNVEIFHASRNTSLVLMLLPMWAPTYPPYNLARLSAVTKAAGYETHVFDVNVKGYKISREWTDLDWDPWHYVYMPRWFSPVYQETVEPLLKPLLQEYVDKVVALNPTVVGFTIYDQNKEPVKWVNAELKKRLPNLITVLGGPICHRDDPHAGPGFDSVVSGEGEELILRLLEDVEKYGKPQERYKQEFNQRINLDTLPLPDYSHFEFNDYEMPNGATTELSRGCTAKCVFCDETHFWKYRNRSGSSVFDEIKYLYEHGVNYIWFLDSLVNGNLRELRSFCEDIKNSDMEIGWSGYARCDGRMDLEFFQLMKDSGCVMLSCGVESCSDKVLKDMNKGITRKEIEDNFRDADIAGIHAVIMMIPGFPTETPKEAYETLQVLWRLRNRKINYIAAGQIGLIVNQESILGHMREDYGILLHSYNDTWINKNFDNSAIHRVIRVKVFNIFLNNLVNERNINFSNRPSIESHYKLNIKDPTIQNEIEVEEDFDFDIIKANTGNNLGDTVVNEIWPILRLFYRTRGAFDIEIRFDGEEDGREFSHWLGLPFYATYKFAIDEEGNWKADFKLDYKQPEDVWCCNIYNDLDSNAVKRIQTWAKKSKYPKVTLEEAYEDYLHNYKDIDLSFNYHYVGEGKW